MTLVKPAIIGDNDAGDRRCASPARNEYFSPRSRPSVRPSVRGKFIAENKLRVVYGCQLVPYGTSGLERVNNETHA